jgi:hypothetical protein
LVLRKISEAQEDVESGLGTGAFSQAWETHRHDVERKQGPASEGDPTIAIEERQKKQNTLLAEVL